MRRTLTVIALGVAAYIVALMLLAAELARTLP